MDNPITCSGALFYATATKRFLFLYRNNGKHNNVWGLPGGTGEKCETPHQTLLREIREETGQNWDVIKTLPLETYVSKDSRFTYHTYVCIVKNEFLPTLNSEHSGYAWVGYDKWPKPLHSGLRSTLSNRINRAKLETVFKIIDLID